MNRFIKCLALVLAACCLSGCSLIGKHFSGLYAPDESRNNPPVVTVPQQTPGEQTETPPPSQQTEPTVPVPTEPVTTEPVATAPSVDDHTAKIKQIRSWYQEIVLSSALVAKTYADAATVYFQNGEVVSIAEYRQLNDADDPAEATVHFYYRNGIPFFVFIEFENYAYEEVRLYFSDGELIRWIIDENAPKDNVPNAELERYYEEALSALQSLPPDLFP